MPPTAPSGSSSQAADAYYQWLWAQRLAQNPSERTSILWSGPFWIALWAVILILFFFFYVTYVPRTHRKKGALYGVASFAGSILERIGPPSVFQLVMWFTIFLWALYYLVTTMIEGQIY